MAKMLHDHVCVDKGRSARYGSCDWSILWLQWERSSAEKHRSWRRCHVSQRRSTRW